jgi:hypothetical protein
MSNIKLFESKQIRATWDENEQKWFFSVHDVVEVLTESSDVKQYIKRMLSRDEMLKSNWGTICTLVEMKAADGKRRINSMIERISPQITQSYKEGNSIYYPLLSLLNLCFLCGEKKDGDEAPRIELKEKMQMNQA